MWNFRRWAKIRNSQNQFLSCDHDDSDEQSRGLARGIKVPLNTSPQCYHYLTLPFLCSTSYKLMNTGYILQGLKTGKSETFALHVRDFASTTRCSRRKGLLCILPYSIGLFAAKDTYDNCMVSPYRWVGVLEVLPKNILKIYSSNGEILGIFKPNFWPHLWRICGNFVSALAEANWGMLPSINGGVWGSSP